MRSIADLIKRRVKGIDSVMRVEAMLDRLPRWSYRFIARINDRVVEGVAEISWRDGKPELMHIEML